MSNRYVLLMWKRHGAVVDLGVYREVTAIGFLIRYGPWSFEEFPESGIAIQAWLRQAVPGMRLSHPRFELVLLPDNAGDVLMNGTVLCCEQHRKEVSEPLYRLGLDQNGYVLSDRCESCRMCWRDAFRLGNLEFIEVLPLGEYSAMTETMTELPPIRFDGGSVRTLLTLFFSMVLLFCLLYAIWR
jgi:hypothetical protein